MLVMFCSTNLIYFLDMFRYLQHHHIIDVLIMFYKESTVAPINNSYCIYQVEDVLIETLISD